MAREIELKIRLDDPQSFQALLADVAVPGAAYEKADTYFRGSRGSFRLRETEEGAVVCSKDKTIVEGIEVNKETEFPVGDARAFRLFASSLGYDEWYSKAKKGQAWRWGEVLIEVGTVSHLGWFAEFELLIDEDKNSLEIEKARQTLFDLLLVLGVPRDKVEPRTYSELLGHRES